MTAKKKPVKKPAKKTWTPAKIYEVSYKYGSLFQFCMITSETAPGAVRKVRGMMPKYFLSNCSQFSANLVYKP